MNQIAALLLIMLSTAMWPSWASAEPKIHCFHRGEAGDVGVITESFVLREIRINGSRAKANIVTGRDADGTKYSWVARHPNGDQLVKYYGGNAPCIQGPSSWARTGTQAARIVYDGIETCGR